MALSAAWLLKGSIGKIIASGGSVGTIPDYSHTVIESKFGIKQITAKAVEGDDEILGGFIHSDISTESWIGVKGPVSPNQFKFRRLIQSEIWVDGHRTM